MIVYINLFWKPVVEILILWYVIYQVMLFFEGTRAVQVVRGVVIILAAFFIFQRLNLQVLEWLLTKLFGISVIAVLIIFHPEIRQGLANLGRRHIFATPLREEELDFVIKEVSRSCEDLSKNRFGALIVIEKNDPLAAYAESGVPIDSRVCADLIEAIFTPHNPLHDGGIIIRQGRIVAAGCLFPISQSPDINRLFGTRHRAALGLSEETDAVVLIISEERQDVSLVYHGRLYRDLSREEVFLKVKDILKTEKKNA